ncbi:MAG: efflux RND transporter permease subunit [Methylococcales bacterium]|nr:efflux RND transporter permease subunit [Methylococcales bacterium]
MTTPVTAKTGPIAWMAGHKVAANLLMLLMLVGGLLMLKTVKQEVFPEFEIDRVSVSVAYPGASPEEVESGIVLAIEDAVSGLEGIDEVTATAREGMGSVTVEALLGADLQRLAQDVEREVDRITTFPEDAEKPQVTVMARKRQVVSVVIYGQATDRVLQEIAERFRDQLLQLPDITQVELSGVKPMQISIEIPEENLRRYQLSIGQIADRLTQANIDLPGGSIKASGGEILLRVKERKDRGAEYLELPVITTADGSQVRLGDIATIIDGYDDSDYYATYNGLPAVMVDVFRVGGQTPIEIAATVRAFVDNAQLPAGIAAAIEQDDSLVYQQRIDLLLRNSGLGLILVFGFLALFLEIRLAFWVMMGIPTAFLGAFLVLPLLGVSLNMISLFAFIIALGIVVDDAIVIGENVYHYRQEGWSPLQAAIQGAKDMASPVTFSILTNVVTFLPLLFIPGFTGKIFGVIPLVVITVFLLSLLESLFVLPMHLGHLPRKQRLGPLTGLHHAQQRFSHAFRNWVQTYYGAVLDFVLRHRGFTILAAVALMVLVLTYVASGRMGITFFPRTESDYAQASLTLPFGTPMAETERIAQRLIATARETAEATGQAEVLVKGIFTEMGTIDHGLNTGSHLASVRVYLAPPEIRERIISTDAFSRDWRQRFGEMPGIETLSFASDSGGPGSGAALTIELSHRDLDVLEQASADLAKALKNYPNVQDVNDGFSPGKEQLTFSVLPEGKSLGLNAQSVARQVRNAYYGAEVLRLQRGRNEVKIVVRLPEAERQSLFQVRNLLLWTPAGVAVPLREVAGVKQERSYTAINRRAGRRSVNVTGDLSNRSQAQMILADLEKTELPRLQQSYPGLEYSFQGRQADMAESLGSLKTGFLFALMGIYILLAIPFRSYWLPFVVIISIPFGIIGAILGHLLLGYSLSIVSMLGVVALSGIVVNDALVLIAYAGELRRQGQSALSAIRNAGIQRFRPIILTTLTTFGGLMPMILETSRQARILIPMALSIGFGVVFATLITLLLIPALYLTIERR